jgi:hypothetical protein
MMPPNKQQREQLREWLELADNLHDERGNLVKGLDYIDPDTLSIGEAYEERPRKACHLHVSLDTRGIHSNTHHLCIAYQRLKVANGAKLDHLAPDILKDTLENTNVSSVYENRGHHPMFVVIGQISKPGERMSRGEARHTRYAPFVVRLIPLDDCPVTRLDQVQLSGSLEVFRSRVGGGRVVLDRELDLVGVTRVAPFGLDKTKLPNQMVQSPPKVVNHISDHDAPTGIPLSREGRCPEDVISAFRVELDTKSYLVAFRPKDSLKLVQKNIAVLFGPPDLAPTTTEVGLVGHDG